MTAINPLSEPVLSLEDLPDSTAAVVGSLNDEGLDIVPALTVQHAAKLAMGRTFGLILLDARVPDNGKFEVDAGIDFIVKMKTQKWGQLNRTTPFLVLTSFVQEIDVDRVKSLPGFLGVMSKAAVTADLLREMLDMPLRLDRAESHGEFIVEDLIFSERGANGDGTISFTVPAWEGDEEVVVTTSTMPDDVQIEFGWGDLPFFVWARVNIAAEIPEDVRPRDFRLYIGDEREVQAFETGEE